mgnify:CR=1 FL=1|jgi:hypothetical protein
MQFKLIYILVTLVFLISCGGQESNNLQKDTTVKSVVDTISDKDSDYQPKGNSDKDFRGNDNKGGKSSVEPDNWRKIVRPFISQGL